MLQQGRPVHFMPFIMLSFHNIIKAFHSKEHHVTNRRVSRGALGARAPRVGGEEKKWEREKRRRNQKAKRLSDSLPKGGCFVTPRFIPQIYTSLQHHFLQCVHNLTLRTSHDLWTPPKLEPECKNALRFRWYFVLKIMLWCPIYSQSLVKCYLSMLEPEYNF